MIAKRAALDLKDFALLHQQYQFTPPAEEDIDVEATLAAYVVEIDFSINSADGQIFQLFVGISVNRDGALPGYTMYCKGAGVFDFSEAPKLTEKEKGDFLQLSGISICVNQLRGIISSLTAQGPFGRYLLPAIDVNDLLQQKVKSLEKQKSRGSKTQRV